jgi:hypothetical protein
MEETIEESASQLLGKAAKVEMGQELVLLEDLRQLARDERDSVRHYKQRLNLAPKRDCTAEGDMGGDIILCDDYRRSNGLITVLLAVLFFVALLAVTAVSYWAVMSMTRAPEAAPVAAPVESHDGYRYDVEPWRPGK